MKFAAIREIYIPQSITNYLLLINRSLQKEMLIDDHILDDRKSVLQAFTLTNV